MIPLDSRIARRAALLLLAPALAMACARGPAVAASASAPMAGDSAWIPLFDGRSLHGWRGLASSEVPARWSVEDGAIHKPASGAVATQADGQPIYGADLMTEGSWRDFELEWEWKVAPGANSGIKYNVSEELSALLQPTHAAKGFEYQMLDDDRHPDGKLPTHRAGALYDLVAPSASRQLHPAGEWNSARIVLVGNHGEHWLNGTRILSYDLGSATMDSALTASKFRTMPWFAQRRVGHIVLQDHGDEVWVRNVKIREKR